MADHTNRTFFCSVLFLDIVEYSKRVVAEQIRLKEQFNAVLTEAISGVATDDRIILDTGDGAAVTFLGDPEDAMFAGLSLRDAVAGHDRTGGPRLLIRIGINLGPVRLVKDINGQPNIIGDGINVAQRVMSFAKRGEILVSHSYYDEMVRLSEDYSQLFHFKGMETDKHVREHKLYAVSTTPSNLRRTVPIPAPKPVRRLSRLSSIRLPSIRMPALPIPRVNLRPLAAQLAVNSKLLIAAPLAFILIVSSGVIARSHKPSTGEEKAPAVVQPGPGAASKADTSAAEVAAAEPDTPRSAEPSGAAGEQASGAPPKAVGPHPQAKHSRPGVKVKAIETGTPTRAGDPGPSERAKAPLLAARAKDAAEMRVTTREADILAAPRPSAPDAAINVVIVAFPWAEVYVDGTKLGVSPPLRSIALKTGKHKVELRNSSFPAHVETIEVKPGAEISVKHRFRR